MREILSSLVVNRFDVGAARVSSTTPCLTHELIKHLINREIKGYICVSNVRTVAFANQTPEYCQILNNSLMTLPDGMPLVWLARLWGLKDVQRTTGPDLFVRMLSDTQSGIRHFLLGDTEETLAAIWGKYPDANICGTLSPPFCKVDEFDYELIAKMVNQSGADIIWISLRSPKQDFFAVRLLPYLDKGICIGVGAAFRFAVGQIKHPPKIIKTMGLTGLFWRKWTIAEIFWYIKHTFWLTYWTICILMKRTFGIFR